MSEPIPAFQTKSKISTLVNKQPTTPAAIKKTLAKKEASDPSSALPGERSYPIPSFLRVQDKAQRI